jgi:hypothetical protein
LASNISQVLPKGRSHWEPRAVGGINVAPAVAADKYLGFCNVPDPDDGAAQDDPDGEMGGPVGAHDDEIMFP